MQRPFAAGTGWSGRHPRGRETRRFDWAGSVNGLYARRSNVLRTTPSILVRHSQWPARGLRRILFHPVPLDSTPSTDRSLRYLALTTLICSPAVVFFGRPICTRRRDALHSRNRSAHRLAARRRGCLPRGDLAHIFLLVGLMLLLLAVLKAREAALRRPESRNDD